MKDLFSRFGLLVLVHACMAAVLPLGAATKPTEFLVPARLHEPKFSGDGRFVAVGSRDENGRRFVIVTECATMRETPVFVIDDLSQSQDRTKNVTSFAWAGNDHLVLTSDITKGANSLHHVEAGKRYVSASRRDARYTFIAALPDDGEFLVAARPMDDKRGICRVLRLSAKDPSLEEEVFRSESGTFECVPDRQGRLGLVKRDDPERGQTAWFAHDAASASWRRLALPHWVRVFGFDYKPGLILVGGTRGSPHPGLHYYSLMEDRYVHTLATNDRHAMDQVATPLFSEATQTLVGVHVDGDLPTSRWVDPRFKRFQDSIDTALKDSRNRIVAWSPDLARLLVERIYGDAPPRLSIVDNEKVSISTLLTDGGQVDRKDTATVQLVTFENRAGVKLAGYLTRPRSDPPGGHPLVILVRPDPWSHKNNYGWDNQAQFLGAQGMAVLRLNFRGSGRLVGTGHVGWKTRADVLGIFEDIADAIDHLAQEKMVDGGRVAIAGFGGAGGWIAAYAPVALPGRFRGAAALGGHFDLVAYRTTVEMREPLRDMGRIPFAEPGSALSLDDLRALSPMHNLSPGICPLFIDFGRWSPDRFSNATFDFTREARKAGIDLERPLAADFYGAIPERERILNDYFGRLAAFLKKRL